MELGLAIVVAALAVIIVLILAIIIYHQMLLLNEVNKRLLLVAKESIEKERITMEELQDTIRSQMDQGTRGLISQDEEDAVGDEPFDPHKYEENLD